MDHQEEGLIWVDNVWKNIFFTPQPYIECFGTPSNPDDQTQMSVRLWLAGEKNPSTIQACPWYAFVSLRLIKRQYLIQTNHRFLDDWLNPPNKKTCINWQDLTDEEREEMTNDLKTPADLGADFVYTLGHEVIPKGLIPFI